MLNNVKLVKENIYELIPEDSHKSFYKKAFLMDTPNYVYLQSYNTVVAFYDKHTGKVCKSWNYYSSTTMRHINAFLHSIGMGKINKKEWEGMEYFPHNISTFIKVDNYYMW